MVKTAGIAGAGLVGRLLALRLLQEGWSVTIFDQDDIEGRKSCGFIAGGMLSLYSEAEIIGDLIVELGHRSIGLWSDILRSIGAEECFRTSGSIIVAHAGDLSDLERMCITMRRRFPEIFRDLHITDNIRDFVPGLAVSHGMYISGEGSIDSMYLFRSLETSLKSRGVVWHSAVGVEGISSGEIVTSNWESQVFDFVFDCRGIGAKSDIPDLRGVRGEAILVHAPAVDIDFPIRMTHPRYSIYVVPRQGNMYLIGATEIESLDFSEVSVQSALEMLSAAYSLHRGFAEGRIRCMMTACRPAFPDNLPRVFIGDRMARINGLYRYGYLVSPAIVEEVILHISGGKTRYPMLYYSI